RMTASSASSSANAARSALSQVGSGRRLRWPETVSAACARKSLKLNVLMPSPSASSPDLPVLWEFSSAALRAEGARSQARRLSTPSQEGRVIRLLGVLLLRQLFTQLLFVAN